MEDEIMNAGHPKKTSIFARLLISYLGVGILIVLITAGEQWFREQNIIRRELNAQFSNSLNTAVTYFKNVYASRITEDLELLERSNTFNNYLSSTNEEKLVSKSLVEQLFLHFTNRINGIYLSARFIDSQGTEKIIAEGNKRRRNYAALTSYSPDDALRAHIYTLFKKLKSGKTGHWLIEGPFKYGDRFTFLAGISKSDPEVGGDAGAVIFHCDLKNYFAHLAKYAVYHEPVASVYTLDNKPMRVAPQINPPFRFYPGAIREKEPRKFYEVSETVKFGARGQAFFKVVFSISPRFSQVKSILVLKQIAVFILVILALLILLAFGMSKHFSKPLVELAAATNRFAAGDLTARVNVRSNDEIGILVDSFNNMVTNLQKVTVSRDELFKEIVRRQVAEERILKLNECFLSFGAEPAVNINLLTRLCGEIMEASHVLYSQAQEGAFKIIGQWQIPAGFNSSGHEENRLCRDVLARAEEESPVVIRRLQETPYAKTEHKILKYDLRTYVGFPVRQDRRLTGLLCVFFKKDFAPQEEDKKILGIIASAISVEESRLRVENVMRESEKNFRTFFNTIDDLIVVGTPEGKLVYSNPAVSKKLGYAADELKKMGSFKFVVGH